MHVIVNGPKGVCAPRSTRSTTSCTWRTRSPATTSRPPRWTSCSTPACRTCRLVRALASALRSRRPERWCRRPRCARLGASQRKRVGLSAAVPLRKRSPAPPGERAARASAQREWRHAVCTGRAWMSIHRARRPGRDTQARTACGARVGAASVLWRCRHRRRGPPRARAGFRVCEVGAGTGGLTRDAFPILDVDNHCEVLQYTATDISAVWAPRLLESFNTSKLQFKARARRPRGAARAASEGRTRPASDTAMSPGHGHPLKVSAAPGGAQSWRRAGVRPRSRTGRAQPLPAMQPGVNRARGRAGVGPEQAGAGRRGP